MRVGWMSLGKYSNDCKAMTIVRRQVIDRAVAQGHTVEWIGMHKRVEKLERVINVGPILRRAVLKAKKHFKDNVEFLENVSLANVDMFLFAELDALMIECDCNTFKIVETVAMTKLLIEAGLPLERTVFWVIDPAPRMSYLKKFRQAGIDTDKMCFATTYEKSEFKKQYVLYIPYDPSTEVEITKGNGRLVYTGNDYDRRETMARLFDDTRIHVYGNYTKQGAASFVESMNFVLHEPVSIEDVVNEVSTYTGSLLIAPKWYTELRAWSDRINQEVAAGTPVIVDVTVQGRRSVMDTLLKTNSTVETVRMLKRLYNMPIYEYKHIVNKQRAAVKATAPSYDDVLAQLTIGPGTRCKTLD